MKLLGISINNNICTKDNQKISVLGRMRHILNFEQRRRIFKSFFESQFKYSPLIFMFCSRKANNKINELHERALRIDYQTNISNSDELLEKGNFFSIHHQNIRTLAIEMYKVYYGLSEDNFYGICENSRSSYNLRSQHDLDITSVNTESYGENSHTLILSFGTLYQPCQEILIL